MKTKLLKYTQALFNTKRKGAKAQRREGAKIWELFDNNYSHLGSVVLCVFSVVLCVTK